MASSSSSSGAPGAHLRDGELRLRLALEAAYVIAFEWDIPRDEVRRLYSTDLTLGPTADDAPVSFATVCQVVHPDDRELFVARVQAAFAHPDGRYEAEYRIVRGDGAVTWLAESGRVQFAADRQPQRLIGLSQDITARKAAEARVVASETLLRSIFDASPVLMGLVELPDDDSAIIHVVDSPATARFFGQVDGVTAGSALKLGVPVDAEHLWIAKYRASEQAGGPVRFEYQHPKDGGLVWLSCLVMPLPRGPSGRARFSYMALEVTDRKHIEAQVAGQARLLDLSGDAILTRDASDHITFWSRGATDLYGFTADEALGRVSHDLLHTVLPAPLAGIRAELDEHRQWQGELVQTTKDGTTVTTLSRWVLDAPPRGGPVSILESNTDISARKVWEAQLVDADRRKDEHLAMLAHELRNPLAPLRTSSAIIRARAGGDPVLQRSAAVMERQIAHMARLLDDLLDVSRLSRGTFTLQRAAVPLAEVIDLAVETTAPLIAEQGHQLTIEGGDAAVLLDADAARLAQVFANLLNNAAKYSPRGGDIRLAVAVDGADAVVTVSDTGVGIPAAAAEHVFELFGQMDTTRHRAQGGLGIGLPLARLLVERHGGTIALASAGTGRGSTFTVRLPRLHEAAAAAPTAAHAAGPAPGGTNVRVLVADDNHDAADTLTLLLEQFGCQVRTVYGGAEAVAEAARYQPELALLDLGMPGVNGFEACRQLRAGPGGADMRVVAVTGWGQPHDREKSAAHGFDLHLVKPVAPDVIRQIVQDLTRPQR